VVGSSCCKGGDSNRLDRRTFAIVRRRVKKCNKCDGADE
jgi:hypothetical protein